MSDRQNHLLASRRRAFTLVEILIVVVILGILAAIVIPQVSNATQQAREGAIKDDLRFLRLQVQLYRAQHKDTAPGYPGGDRNASPTEGDFVAQMTQYSSEAGAVNATHSSTYQFGPYLMRMPANPISQHSSILIVGNGAALPAPDGSTGWIYKPQTQEWMANLAGSDASGTPYANY